LGLKKGTDLAFQSEKLIEKGTLVRIKDLFLRGEKTQKWGLFQVKSPALD